MEHLLACMKILGDDTIQRTQLTHRIQLVKAFQITKGMKVLEIGCGQGDTTVALADAVGENGQIVAIDIASPEYGAPITLGEAAKAIQQSPIGSRITFQFETDFYTLKQIKNSMWPFYPIAHGTLKTRSYSFRILKS